MENFFFFKEKMYKKRNKVILKNKNKKGAESKMTRVDDVVRVFAGTSPELPSSGLLLLTGRGRRY